VYCFVTNGSPYVNVIDFKATYLYIRGLRKIVKMWHMILTNTGKEWQCKSEVCVKTHYNWI
jgi:hypothetical protein